jgi:DNA-binding transcriptional MerR regulator
MEYRVDQLAARAGLTVDTVRFYQARGLLPRPRRAGRVALYSDAHLALLRRIRKLSGRGLSLAVIHRILQGRRSPADDDLLSAVLQEEEASGRTFSPEALAAEAGIPLPLLASLEASGLLEPMPEPDGRAVYGEADLQIVKAGLALLEFGFPINEILDLAVAHHRAIEETVDRAIDLFDRYVRKPAGSGAEGQVAEAFTRLLPLITSMVDRHFQRTLIGRARRRLDRAGDSEGLAAALAAVEGSVGRGRGKA